jgi:hypothetical protein
MQFGLAGVDRHTELFSVHLSPSGVDIWTVLWRIVQACLAGWESPKLVGLGVGLGQLSLACTMFQ